MAELNYGMRMDEIIYIDGIAHRCTPLGTSFYVDHPSLPHRYCAHHSLTAASVHHLRGGGAVRTSGHRYSLRPDAPVPAPAPVDAVSTIPPAPQARPSLLRRCLNWWLHGSNS